VSSVELEISNFKSQLRNNNQEKLPSLEEAKRLAIENRSFKEAKEINDEIKTIMDELSVSDEKFAQLKSKLTDTRNALRDARQTETRAIHDLKTAETQFQISEAEIVQTYHDRLNELFLNGKSEEVRFLVFKALENLNEGRDLKAPKTELISDREEPVPVDTHTEEPLKELELERPFQESANQRTNDEEQVEVDPVSGDNADAEEVLVDHTTNQ
jgi:hypothetical protein